MIIYYTYTIYFHQSLLNWFWFYLQVRLGKNNQVNHFQHVVKYFINVPSCLYHDRQKILIVSRYDKKSETCHDNG